MKKSYDQLNAEDVQINFRVKRSGKITSIEINSKTFESEMFARQWVNARIFPQQISMKEMCRVKLINIITRPSRPRKGMPF